MPLTLVRSDSNANLWQTCVSRFLDELGEATGGTKYGSHLWVTHRTQRDLLLEAAKEGKLPGWFSPPFSFFSELASRFGIELQPLSHLRSRLLLTNIAKSIALRHKFTEAENGGHIYIDQAFWELLPEGISPDELQVALDQLGGDDFTARRNRWLLDTYRDYLSQVADQGCFDSRSTHSLIADRIRRGGLPAALGGATQLHIYGLASLHRCVRLFEALSAQDDAEVCAYVPSSPQPGEWERIADKVEDLNKKGAATDPVVHQPFPSGLSEANWVAKSTKALLLKEKVRPHQIAVLVPFGKNETRQIREALHQAGVPTTARIRSPLSEAPALRAVLGLFEAVGENWSWPTLRSMVTSPYFEVPADLSAFEHLASRSRPQGLSDWIEKLKQLRKELGSSDSWRLEQDGVSLANVDHGISVLTRFAEAATDLSEPRSVSDWIESTQKIIRSIRQRICKPAGDHWDIVRLDQRGALVLEQFFREWSDLLAESNAESLNTGAWHIKLKRELEFSNIVLSTPLQRGAQVLEAREAAMTPFEHVFIVHANEGVFPFRRRPGLFTESERERLYDLGIPLATYELYLERERRLWQACSGSAKVVATFWKADANGREQLPSIFLPPPKEESECPSLVTRAELLKSEIGRFAKMRRGADLSLFQTPDPHAIRHALLSAFADELRNGGLDRFGELETDIQTDVPVAAKTASSHTINRLLSERPTAWNGLIRDPIILNLIAKKYWADRTWSATWLEKYSERPFDFLLEKVLRLKGLEEATDEISPLNKGTLAHKVLENFYRDFDVTSSTEQALERLDQVFNGLTELAEKAELTWLGLPVVWAAVERSKLKDQLRNFVMWEINHKHMGSVLAVELRFGYKTELGVVDLSGVDQRGIQHGLFLGGKIDRVDCLGTDEDGVPQLRVVDYKTGSWPKLSEYKDAATLQCPLYMAAIERLGLGKPVKGVYRSIKDPGDRSARKYADVEPALQLAREIPDRIRAGRFEAVQANSKDVAPWQPGQHLTRTKAQISSGSRYDLVTLVRLPGSLVSE